MLDTWVLIKENLRALQLSSVSRLKHEHFVELIGYCMEANNHILVYQFATLGSLHDILHGIYIILVLSFI